MGKENRVEMQFSSIGENVALARMVVSGFLLSYDLTCEELDEIKIALSEAVSNSIIHGYGEAEDEMVTLRLWLSEEKLTIEIEDQGVGIPDIAQALEPAFSTKEEHMGLGFIFMQTFMDEVQVYSQVGQGTRVVLRKQLTAGQQMISEVG